MLCATKSERELLNVAFQIVKPHMPHQPADVGQRHAPKKKAQWQPPPVANWA